MLAFVASRNMGAVSLADQIVQSYQVKRKRKKVWYKKQFQHLVNKTVLSCYILYKKTNAGSKITHLDFVVKLIERLIEQCGSEVPQMQKGRPSQDVVVDPSDRKTLHQVHYCYGEETVSHMRVQSLLFTHQTRREEIAVTKFGSWVYLTWMQQIPGN